MLDDTQQALGRATEALARITLGHPDRVERLKTLPWYFKEGYKRLEALEALEDLEEFIEEAEESLAKITLTINIEHLD